MITIVAGVLAVIIAPVWLLILIIILLFID